MPFTNARTSPTGTRKVYRNLDQATGVVAHEHQGRWYARAEGANGEYYFGDAAGYDDREAAETAIEDLLGISSE